MSAGGYVHNITYWRKPDAWDPLELELLIGASHLICVCVLGGRDQLAHNC